MLGRLMPREGKFFDLFNAHAERIAEGGRELAQMIGTFTELEAHAQRIDAAERAADKITHETIALLHKTFITPFDRDQIHQLINTLDDILDLIQDVAESVALYDLRRATPEAKQLAEINQMCCERVKTADRVLRGAMSKLFRDEPDVKQLIKLRTIYELLETISDRCEDVANIIEGIVLENS
jgi:hypothetical protein